MELITKMHTIFMLVGSTECGKTTFAEKVLIPQLRFEDEARGFRSNVQYLSSDRIRQEVLGYDYDKYDNVMLGASAQAFHLLFERLKMVTSFPVQAEFVVLDTTGLAEDFRHKVWEIAHQNNYHLEVILFDYRKREDYYASDRSKKVITQHINRLKKEVLGALPREKYSKIHKVREKNFYNPSQGDVNPEYNVTIEDKEAYLQTILPHSDKYIVVGDVHECVGTLQGLLQDYGYSIEQNQLITGEKSRPTKIILAGDWIDKGGQTKEIVEFLYDNRVHFLFVLGNHENFVYNYLHGTIGGVEQEVLQTYFDSVETLRENPELLAKFNHLVALSQPFYRLIGGTGPSFYVTHAPCKNKYLGKLDTSSRRHQRSYRLNRELPIQDQLTFLQEEAVSNHPYHVFGHIAAQSAFRLKNKIHIDTGCVHGNALTSVTFSFKPILKSHRAAQAAVTEELPVLFKQEPKVSVRELGEDELRRLRYVSRHKINFISGTMSPADKDEQAYELESLKRGLRYFEERGVCRVVLQPKYMGSRCNVYLHRDPAQCFAVSRNGYKINQVDLAAIYEKLLLKFGAYMDKHEVRMLVLDGELLPWKALGDGLIERQFKPIGKALETEFAFLQQFGFEEALGKLSDAYRESGFEKDQYHISKTALSDKYGAHVYQNYKHVKDMLGSYVPLSEHKQAYETYKRQLDIYGGGGELEYKPFALLKLVFEDGREQLPDSTTTDMYRFVSEDEALALDLTEADSLERAERYFARLTVDQHMEGVVIKPDIADAHAVPFMKVRNSEYLSIVYGYDYKFPHKYKKLIKQKSIVQKLRTSMNEHRLGIKMLETPFTEITPQNAAYQEAAAGLLFEVAREREIDPRL